MLNAEGLFTVLLAWFAFKETFDRRIAFGMIAIMIVGALILSWPGEARFAGFWPAKHSPSTARAGADVPNRGGV